MFWYQCRYCKVNFDQWEKLVIHRKDEHRQEFEALKRRSALLLRRQEEADTARNRLESCGNTNAIIVVKTSSPIKMKPTASSTSPSRMSSSVTSPPRRNQHSASKELDAKDLENQEISLCIPSSSLNLRSSATSSSSFNRSSTPPYSFPTPSSSPCVNGYNTPHNRSKFSCNGSNSRLTTSTSSFLTPPGTPSRVLSSSSSCPLLSAEELVLNINWSPPADIRKAVYYHQMSDDDEIEISVIPSAGSSISVTKHSPSSTTPPTRPPPPPYSNGSCSSIESSHNYSNGGNQHAHNHRQQSQQQLISNSHVVIENLEDELRMTCSNESTISDSQRESGRETSAIPKPSALRGVRRKSHVEMLRSTGQGLKRLHSQLQRRQNLQHRSKVMLASRLTSTASSSSGNAPASIRHGHNDAATKRIRITKTSSSINERKVGLQSGRLRRSSGGNISTNVPRLTTRASARRPK